MGDSFLKLQELCSFSTNDCSEVYGILVSHPQVPALQRSICRNGTIEFTPVHVISKGAN